MLFYASAVVLMMTAAFGAGEELAPGEHGSGTHTDGPYAEHERFLTWMLWTARMTHPRVSAQERAGYHALLAQRIETLAGEPPDTRIAEFEGLLGVGVILASPAAKPLLIAWATAQHERADAMPTPRERHQALTELSLRAELKGQPMAKTVADELKELRKDPAIRKEFAAWQAIVGLREQEAKVGAAKGKILDLAKAYHALAQRYPETLVAPEATAAAKRLADLADK